MKIFKRYDRTEGENLETDIFFSWGRQLLTNGEDDGWFAKVEIPWTMTKNFISVKTFEPETGLCRYMMLYRHRPNGNHYFNRLWAPIEDKQ